MGKRLLVISAEKDEGWIRSDVEGFFGETMVGAIHDTLLASNRSSFESADGLIGMGLDAGLHSE
jgi:hypothetical protein